jgi:16S rRNA (cytosine967-C5)-methyltransferase
MAAMNRPGRLFARVNTLRTTPQALLASLEPGERALCRPVRENVLDVTDLPHERLLSLLNAGSATIEDSTAMLPVEAMGLEPGMSVLDLCAAPGGKASYIAERLRGQGAVWALDREGAWLEMLRQTLRRLGHDGVGVAANPAAGLPEGMPAAFDRVLVDVPCSNTGVLGRRADARWRLAGGLPKGLADVQAALLAQGLDLTRPGGLCVYSTCSLEPEENGGIVRRATGDRGDATLQVERETRPSEAGDGGYFAVIMRLEAV